MPLDEPVCVFEETPRDGSGQSKEDTSGKSKEYPDDTSSVCNEDDNIRKCQRQMDGGPSSDEEISLSMPSGLTNIGMFSQNTLLSQQSIVSELVSVRPRGNDPSSDSSISSSDSSSTSSDTGASIPSQQVVDHCIEDVHTIPEVPVPLELATGAEVAIDTADSDSSDVFG